MALMKRSSVRKTGPEFCRMERRSSRESSLERSSWDLEEGRGGEGGGEGRGGGERNYVIQRKLRLYLVLPQSIRSVFGRNPGYHSIYSSMVCGESGRPSVLLRCYLKPWTRAFGFFQNLTTR